MITKSVSRFARNTHDLLQTVRLLKSLGVTVMFEEQGIDTAKLNSEMFLTFPGMIAQQESESISGNMRWSYKKRMESGEFNTCLEIKVRIAEIDAEFKKLLSSLSVDLENNAYTENAINKLWNNDKTIHGFADSVLTLGIVSDYLRNTNNQNMKIRQAVAALETQYKTLNNQNYNNALKSYYSLAYMISDERVLNINGKKFKTISELVSYLNLLVSYSYERFVNFTNLITNKSNDLNPQFEAWLIAIGKRDELTKWFNSIK